VKVWLTRSEPGATRQARALQEAGHTCLVAPVLVIEPLPAAPPAGRFDVVIFLSEHAVRHGLAGLELAGARLLAVGAQTAAALGRAGLAAEQPMRADSEGLLALPALTMVSGRRVLLVCGAGGRMLLARELAARGAEVDRYVCYQRRSNAALAAELGEVDVIVAGSADGLAHAARLWFAAGERSDVAVLVPSARVRDHGLALGFTNVHDCQGADTAAVLRGLEWLGRTGMQ